MLLWQRRHVSYPCLSVEHAPLLCWAAAVSSCVATSIFKHARACVRACAVSFFALLRACMEQVSLKVLKKKLTLPGHLGTHTHSLLKGLLTRDPDRRLGCKGTNEVLPPRLQTTPSVMHQHGSSCISGTWNRVQVNVTEEGEGGEVEDTAGVAA